MPPAKKTPRRPQPTTTYPEIKTEKIEFDQQPVIFQTIQSVKIKQEFERDFVLELPLDDCYEEIEVLDEFIEEVQNMSPQKVKIEPKVEENQHFVIEEELLDIKQEDEQQIRPKVTMRRIASSASQKHTVQPVDRMKKFLTKVQSAGPQTIKYLKPTPITQPSQTVKLRGVRVKLDEIFTKQPHEREFSLPRTIDPKDVKVPSCFSTIERTFKCKNCPLSFKQKNDLNLHQIIHKKFGFWCKKCGRKFRFQSSLKKHDCQFFCNICGKIISNKANLNSHLTYVHGIGKAKLFTCDICGTTYKSKRNIDTHMKKHMKSTPFSCAVCCKGFSHASALKIHMWNHRDLVTCEVCKKRMKPRSLYYHIKQCRYRDQNIEAINHFKVISPQPAYIINIEDEFNGVNPKIIDIK